MTRYKLFIGEDYQFEECDGGPMPMSREAYAESPYRRCPDHRKGTKVLDYGGSDRPQIQGCAVCERTDYIDVPYAEYLDYYGNPDRHIVIGIIRQDRCPCCKDWRDGGSLYGIDFMDDSPELKGIDLYRQKTYTIEELSGYLAEIAADLDVADFEVTA